MSDEQNINTERDVWVALASLVEEVEKLKAVQGALQHFNKVHKHEHVSGKPYLVVDEL